MLSPTKSDKSCPVMVREALATDIVFVTGVAESADWLAGAFRVMVAVPPLLIDKELPLTSSTSELLEV